MQSLFLGLLNWRTTLIAILVMVVGILPQLSNVLNVLLTFLQTGDFTVLPQLYYAATVFITAIGLLFAKDGATGSRPQEE